jgi:acetyltransferase-like isoleucine patch superfamily enzyme
MIIGLLRRFLKMTKNMQPSTNLENSLAGAVVSGDGSNIVLGKDVSFGGHVLLFGTAPIRIGDNTMIGYGAIIHTSTHDYADHPMWYKRIDRPVSIGKDVWIGTGAILLPGVVVEDYAVVGAGAVVTANVPKGAIVAGNPAVILKWRDPSTYNGQRKIVSRNDSIVQKGGYLEKVCKRHT